ncbi:hypothetical protein PM082_019033 [Marasmius tenuissimus]|nr:hypothetical protein PM082_019033 [Marasmius tenuissimus]
MGNLPFKTKVTEVKEIAEQYGTLARITMPANERNRPAGFANVEFEDEDNARRFCEAIKSGIVVDGRKTFGRLVEKHLQGQNQPPDSNSKLFLGRFPRKPTVQEIEAMFQELQVQSGLGDISIRSNHRGYFAHVQFTTKEAAEEAMKAHRSMPLSLDGQTLYVSYSDLNNKKNPDPPSHVLHFRGHIKEDELKQLLKPHLPNIKNIRYARSFRDDSSQCGFIICADTPSATNILNTYRGKLGLWYAQDYIERPPPSRELDKPNERRRSSYGGDWGGGQRNEFFHAHEDD